jgi:hypothetical protein
VSTEPLALAPPGPEAVPVDGGSRWKPVTALRHWLFRQLRLTGSRSLMMAAASPGHRVTGQALRARPGPLHGLGGSIMITDDHPGFTELYPGFTELYNPRCN